MTSKRPGRRLLRWTWFMAGSILYLLSGILLAQGTSSESKSDDPGVQSTAETSSSVLAKESKAAGNEDEQAAYKQYGSVKLVSRITGLSLDHAYWFCVLLNFIVIAGAIAWASKKRLPTFFRDRTTSIQHAMEEARKTSEEANHRLSNIESRLSQLGAEIEQMRVAAEKEAAAEESRIKAAAIEDARKIVESAGQEIEAAARTARRDLTAYAADLAVSLARKQIHVDTGTDQGLIENFSRQLSQHRDPEIPGPPHGES